MILDDRLECKHLTTYVAWGMVIITQALVRHLDRREECAVNQNYQATGPGLTNDFLLQYVRVHSRHKYEFRLFHIYCTII